MKNTRRRRMKNVRRRKARTRKLRGGLLVDPRSSILPGPLSDMFNSFKGAISESNNTLSGSYPGVDPSWIKQPIAANIM